MTTSDPYQPPSSSAFAPVSTRPDIGWRGAVWFVLPLWFGLFGVQLYDSLTRHAARSAASWEMLGGLLLVALVAAPVGVASARRLGTTGWRRLLLASSRDGLLWAVVAGPLLKAYSYVLDLDPTPPWRLDVMASSIGRLAIATVPLALLLASTQRAWYLRRR
jgi:hypothetical protein